ncbi:hypothetical protein RJ639_006929 [Escallonia herrerae]|uniref:LOB domain-containing protein n=1 Tax=Escallonia herrerae TaxID=1293975 RepID=A0AA88VTQ9_9ASTE|nr:hypothetical protein RJ639_006929 [Escallonia herrerae]
MTVKGGTSQACAACKYQRRRCQPECPLAPYFPANQQKVFRNVHRLFGVANVMKLLLSLNDDAQKDEAMKSVKYESYIRDIFPVHGCCGVIQEYKQALQRAVEELHYVHAQLALCREQQYVQLGQTSGSDPYDAPQPVFQHDSDGHTMAFAATQFSANENVAGASAEFCQGVEEKPLLFPQSPCYDETRMTNSMAIHSQAFAINQQDEEVFQDYNDMPFNTIADDRQSYVESKDACESSSESSLKDTIGSMENVIDDELRSAAACLSLTSVS